MRAGSLGLFLLITAACGGGDDDDGPRQPVDPDTAPTPVIDRFSGEGAILLDRDEMPGLGLPAAGAPIDFDRAPFLVRGLGPGGERVTYYHLDAHQRTPINIYLLHHEGQAERVADQLPIVDYIPGDHGYSDLWRVVRVDVPADYVANTVTASADIFAEGWPFTVTDTIVNCPVVPLGSTATRRRGTGGAELHRGWYEGQVFYYFTFEEAPLRVVNSEVPLGAAFVAFNVNPGATGGGWPSGFMTESGSDRTHVVADALDAGAYSPLRAVTAYDNAAFTSVVDLATAQAAATVALDEVRWNAPIVEIEP
jgi:hypothetical protein